MTKKEISDMLQIYKDQIDFYRNRLSESQKEKEELRKQNFDLQNALMSIRAPEAYRDMKRDNSPYEELSHEEKVRQKALSEMLPKHLNNIEKRLFETPEDMMAALSSAIEPPRPQSLHDNSES